MTFMESVQTCVKQKYAAFSGRASRSEFWWFFLFTVLGGIVLSLIDGVLGTTIGYKSNNSRQNRPSRNRHYRCAFSASYARASHRRIGQATT